MNELILIIEDNESIVKILQRGLMYEGYTVESALDGEKGLKLAK
jgi:DNA-binding response OmpR family regulator